MKFRYPTFPVPEPVPGKLTYEELRKSTLPAATALRPPRLLPFHKGRTEKALRLRISGRVGFQTGISRTVLNSINRSLPLDRGERGRGNIRPGKASPKVPM